MQHFRSKFNVAVQRMIMDTKHTTHHITLEEYRNLPKFDYVPQHLPDGTWFQFAFSVRGMPQPSYGDLVRVRVVITHTKGDKQWKYFQTLDCIICHDDDNRVLI